ncbi:MAG: hypothetical protein ACLFPO_06280 [Spirochaetaceae bacterium]
MGFLFPLIIGVALGYFFKPQLDTFVRRVIRLIDDRRGNDDTRRR